MRTLFPRSTYDSLYDESRSLIVFPDGESGMISMSLDYACMLFASGKEEDLARARKILGQVLNMQCHKSGDKKGLFAMTVAGTYHDLNSNHFHMPYLIDMQLHYRELMGDELRKRFDAAMPPALDAALRRWDIEEFDIHRDGVAYSNIFVMYVRSLVLMAEAFDNDLWRQTARGQWRRWFNRVSYYGIEEFNSPTYNQVIIDCLLEIMEATPDVEILSDARRVLDYVTSVQLAIHHPLLKVPLCGSARDYRCFLPQEERPRIVTDPEFLVAGEGELYQPPAEVVAEYRRPTYPRTVEGWATPVPFLYKSWQVENAGVGSMTGGHYFPQQVHWIAAAGASPEDRAVAVVPFSPSFINGYVAQQEGHSLLVGNKLTNTFFRSQLRANEKKAAERIAERPYEFALTPEWEIEDCEAGFICATAYGWTLRICPFICNNETGLPSPAMLEESEAEYGLHTFSFPEEAVWFGALLLMDKGEVTERPSLPDTEWVGDELHARANGKLSLRIMRRPHGEHVELYDEDYRSRPLFKGPCGEIFPGGLLADVMGIGHDGHVFL